jgi:hypothetical protein
MRRALAGAFGLLLFANLVSCSTASVSRPSATVAATRGSLPVPSSVAPHASVTSAAPASTLAPVITQTPATAVAPPSVSLPPLTGKPGSCLILEERYCLAAKLLPDPFWHGEMVVLTNLPAGTKIFAPARGSARERADALYSATSPTGGLFFYASMEWWITVHHVGEDLHPPLGGAAPVLQKGTVIARTTGKPIAGSPGYVLIVRDQRDPAGTALKTFFGH